MDLGAPTGSHQVSMNATKPHGKFYTYPWTSWSAITCMHCFEPDSEYWMVQQNVSAVGRDLEVSSFWWITKLCPQPTTPQPYGAYHNKSFELTMHSP